MIVVTNNVIVINHVPRHVLEMQQVRVRLMHRVRIIPVIIHRVCNIMVNHVLRRHPVAH